MVSSFNADMEDILLASKLIQEKQKSPAPTIPSVLLQEDMRPPHRGGIREDPIPLLYPALPLPQESTVGTRTVASTERVPRTRLVNRPTTPGRRPRDPPQERKSLPDIEDSPRSRKTATPLAHVRHQFPVRYHLINHSHLLSKEWIWISSHLSSSSRKNERTEHCNVWT